MSALSGSPESQGKKGAKSWWGVGASCEKKEKEGNEQRQQGLMGPTTIIVKDAKDKHFYQANQSNGACCPITMAMIIRVLKLFGKVAL